MGNCITDLEIEPEIRREKDRYKVINFQVSYNNMIQPGLRKKKKFKLPKLMSVIKETLMLYLEEEDLRVLFEDNAATIKDENEYRYKIYLSVPKTSTLLENERALCFLKTKDTAQDHMLVEVSPIGVMSLYFKNVDSVKLNKSSISAEGQITIGGLDCIETVDTMIDYIKISLGDESTDPELAKELAMIQNVIRNGLPGLYSGVCKAQEKK